MRKVYVETLGEGPDLVLLHGWAMNSAIWSNVRGKLAQSFRLHLVDLPGHGVSPTPWINGPDSLKNMSEMIIESLPVCSIICGWSLGGQVAMKLALDVPERISKLILVSTTPSFVQHKDWIWAIERATLKQFIKDLKQDSSPILNRFFTLQISGEVNTFSLLRQLRKNVLRKGMPDMDGLRIGMQILLTTDLRKSIKSIKHPVTLVHGEHDAIVHPNAARWLHKNLQDSKLVMLPDSGHIPFLSHTDQFLSSIFQTTRI